MLLGRNSGTAIVQAPRALPRVIRLPSELTGIEYGHVFLSSILHQHVDELFTGMNVLGCYQFRVTRNSDAPTLIRSPARAGVTMH